MKAASVYSALASLALGIVSSESIICNKEGGYKIKSVDDLSQISSCSSIRQPVEINIEDPEYILEFGLLNSIVNTTLKIEYSQFKSIRFTKLKSVDQGSLVINRLHVKESIELPELTSATNLEIDWIWDVQSIILSKLSHVEKTLEIGFSHQLKQINLNSLERVEGSLDILYNYELELLNLQKLSYVNKANIQSNGITTLSIPNLPSVKHSLEIHGNEELTMIDLISLTRAGDKLMFRDNYKLVDLDLANLEEVGSFVMNGNHALPSVNIPKLTKVHESFIIISDYELTSINMDGIGNIEKEVVFMDNPKLTQLNLNNLSSTDLINISYHARLLELNLPNLSKSKRLHFVNNPVLTTLSIPSLSERVRIDVIDRNVTTLTLGAGNIKLEKDDEIEVKIDCGALRQTYGDKFTSKTCQI